MGCGVLIAALGMRPALGQEQSKSMAEEAREAEEIRLTREVINNERQALVTRAMDLTPDEMQRFWPVYVEYRLDTLKVGDRIVLLITTYADNYENLTDAAADELLTEFISIEEQRAQLKAQYLPKFKEVLPARKVVRFYQIENKLDNIALAELAKTIPLAR
jgi:hypothetical protein